MKPVIVSGIQPTGKLHIGNYLGALKNFVELQNSGKYECFFFVADYHSLTEDYNPKEKKEQIDDLLIYFLSAGLDPKKSTIFVQSEIAEHAELAWILNTITPLGELRRMTQFKDKSTKEAEGVNAGLLTYPVLMSADVLLYNAQFVPVGDDQDQHLELARTLARKFNSKFGKTFVEPQALHTKIPRLMSLDDPEKKMSKSRSEGCLFLDDEPNVIRTKIKKAVTDSGKEIVYNLKEKPAVSNLLLMYSAFGGKKIADIEKMYKGRGYAEFKSDLAEMVVGGLEPIQKKKGEVKKKMLTMKKEIASGNKKVQKIASEKMKEVRKKIGLI